MGRSCLILSLPRTMGAPLAFREMWDSTAAEPPVLGLISKTIKVFGIPHLAKNERDTRISCTRHQERAPCAAFIEESCIKLVFVTKLHRKSGFMPDRSLVEGIEEVGGSLVRQTV